MYINTIRPSSKSQKFKSGTFSVFPVFGTKDSKDFSKNTFTFWHNITFMANLFFLLNMTIMTDRLLKLLKFYIIKCKR